VHNGQPNLRHKGKGVMWVGRPAGNSGSWGDGRKCQGWYSYTFGRKFQIVGTVTLKLRYKWNADKWDGQQIGFWQLKNLRFWFGCPGADLSNLKKGRLNRVSIQSFKYNW